jgi:hypothetical protein
LAARRPASPVVRRRAGLDVSRPYRQPPIALIGVVAALLLQTPANHAPKEGVMTTEAPLVRAQLKTPRAAAVAGIVFSVLLILSIVLIRASVPADPSAEAAWMAQHGDRVRLALNLLPFAGIAFLWFIGVVRDRLGDREDRFFTTVFLGSGLLFLAMMFASAAVAGGLLIANQQPLGGQVGADTYAFGRALTYVIMNTYAMKMAGVFMISTCMVFLRLGVTPRWIAWLGLALAAFLLVGARFTALSAAVFPLWVLLVSVYMLANSLRGTR